VVWRDLNANRTLYPNAAVQYQLLGSAPNRRFIAQWTNVPCYSNACGTPNTFQAVLYETSNQVEFRYQAVPAAAYSPQAGFENADGSVGTNETQYIVSNTSAKFTFHILNSPCVGCRGDMNCDGQISFDDINAFVAILAGGTPCLAFNADCNGDGEINFDDINPFVDLLVNHSGPCQ
jgi:hypothetical protein